MNRRMQRKPPATEPSSLSHVSHPALAPQNAIDRGQPAPDANQTGAMPGGHTFDANYL